MPNKNSPTITPYYARPAVFEILKLILSIPRRILGVGNRESVKLIQPKYPT